MANLPFTVRHAFKIFAVDLKNIFRDSSLAFIFFVPFLLIIFLRLVIPLITGLWAPLSEYYHPVLAVFCLLAAIFPAFLFSFLMLDEKDDNIDTIFKVLPLYPNFMLIYRTFFLFLLGSLFCIIIIISNGLVHFELTAAIALSMATGLISPLPVLLINAYASNKIEAVTWFKFVNMLLILPVASLFITSGWQHLFGLLPTYYLFLLYQDYNWLWLVTGSGYSLLLIIIFYHLYQRKN